MLSEDFKEFIELLNENKKATGRPQDIADAGNLEKCRV